MWTTIQFDDLNEGDHIKYYLKTRKEGINLVSRSYEGTFRFITKVDREYRIWMSPKNRPTENISYNTHRIHSVSKYVGVKTK